MFKVGSASISAAHQIEIEPSKGSKRFYSPTKLPDSQKFHKNTHSLAIPSHFISCLPTFSASERMEPV